MKLNQVSLKNFGSYETLEFDFSVPGLNLVQGATGSGKSTLFDAPAWIMFGITAKDGSVDDVRSWNDPSLPTTGVLVVELAGGKYIEITRVRGKPNENDLYWIEEGDVGRDIRGTNIKETQTMLNLRLGLDSSAYLAGAYFSEQGPSSSFFVSNSNQRRALFDRIANLKFPTSLADHLSDKISEVKKVLVKSQSDVVSLERQLILISNNLKDSRSRSKEWEENLVIKVSELEELARGFDKRKAKREKDLLFKVNQFREDNTFKISSLEAQILEFNTIANSDTKCPTCGNDPGSHNKKHLANDFKLLKQLKEAVNPYNEQFNEVYISENHYDEQINKLNEQVNPFNAQITHFEYQRHDINQNLVSETSILNTLKTKLQSYEELKDLSNVLKEQLLVRSVDQLHHLTNKYLNEYFDGELSVEFIISGPNSLDVNIFKNGHEAVYKQLSKGQRQLLKLSFSVAVMASVADRSGVHFANLFFDEALDGLDIELKVKAFSLFSSLELDHESIFVIDHAEEFKNLFSKQYVVSIIADKSAIIDAEKHENFG